MPFLFEGGHRLDIFLQQVINGLTLGCVYAVVALGYTMVYGIIQLINFAHGEVVMIGCMVAFSVIVALAGSGMPPLVIVGLGILAAVPVCMAVGYTVERVAYRPLRNAPRLAPLITAIGVSIVLQHLALLVWSRNIIAFPQIIELEALPLRQRRARGGDLQHPDRDHPHVGRDDGAGCSRWSTARRSASRCAPRRRTRRSRA